MQRIDSKFETENNLRIAEVNLLFGCTKVIFPSCGGRDFCRGNLLIKDKMELCCFLKVETFTGGTSHLPVVI
jgi:hypothetical protein